MIKILHTSGYGGGWSSDNGRNDEEKLYLLTYQGFIEALERQEQHDEAEDEYEFDRHARINHEPPLTDEWLEICLAAEAAMPEDVRVFQDADHFLRCPYELVKAVPQFVKDWNERFPGSYLPSLYGLNQLKIEEVGGLDTLRIEHHDGNERISYRPGIWG